jgi:hypothetical protein
LLVKNHYCIPPHLYLPHLQAIHILGAVNPPSRKRVTTRSSYLSSIIIAVNA